MQMPLKLNKIAPLENFRHVKRVRKQRLGEKTQLSAILCLACENDQDCIPSNVLELIKLYQLNAFITKVCKFAPLSKEGWEEQCKVWPTSYHPPTYIIDGITGFSEDDSSFVIYSMKFAVHMAKFCERQVINAAIIVDPSTKQVIARGWDQIFSQTPPSDPASVETCCCNEEETTASRSSDCNVDDNANIKSSSRQLYSGVLCLYSWMWAKQKSPTRFCHPLRHAAMVAIENSATRDRYLFPTIGATADTQMESFQASSTRSPIKRQKILPLEVVAMITLNSLAGVFFDAGMLLSVG